MPHQHFQQPTPTTRRLPERRSRTPFYTAVACSSLVLGLLLGVGGFFGVRTLQGDPVRPTDGTSATADGTSTDGASTDGDSSTDGSSGEPTATEIATASETVTETPAGKDEAVDIGTAVRMEQPLQGIPVDMRISTVDWDATDELHDANTFNEAPKAGDKYVLVTLTGVNRGSRTLDASSVYWLSVSYVAPDGTEYRSTSLVTPRYSESSQQKSIDVGDTFFGEYTIPVPEDVDPAGHFVLLSSINAVEDGVWIRAE